MFEEILIFLEGDEGNMSNSENNNSFVETAVIAGVTSLAVTLIGKGIKYGINKITQSEYVKKSVIDSVDFSNHIKEATEMVAETREEKLMIISKIERNQKKIYEFSLNEGKLSKGKKAELDNLVKNTKKLLARLNQILKEDYEIRDDLNSWFELEDTIKRYEGFNKADKFRIGADIKNFEDTLYKNTTHIKEVYEEYDEEMGIAVMFDYGAFSDDPRFQYEEDYEDDGKEVEPETKEPEQQSQPEEKSEGELRMEAYTAFVNEKGWDEAILCAHNQALIYSRSVVDEYYEETGRPKVQHNAHIIGGKKNFCIELQNVLNEAKTKFFEKNDVDMEEVTTYRIDSTKFDVAGLIREEYTENKGQIIHFTEKLPYLTFSMNVSPERDSFVLIVYEADIAEVTVYTHAYDTESKKLVLIDKNTLEVYLNPEN